MEIKSVIQLNDGVDFKKHNALFFAFIFSLLAVFLLIPFSPYAAIIAVFFLLLIFDLSGPGQYYRFCLPILIVLLAYMASTRGIFETPKDDLSDYYKNFIALSRGVDGALFEFGGGLELGFTGVSYLIAKIYPFAPPRIFLFCHLVVIYSIYFVFLDVFILERLRYRVFFILTTCLFLGYTSSSHLLRQTYSSLLMLYALFSVGLNKRLFFVFLAGLFHLSAYPLFVYYVCILKAKKKWLLLLAPFLLVLVFLFTKVIAPILDNYRFLKIDAYLGGDGVDALTIFSLYKESILCFLFVLVMSFFTNRFDRLKLPFIAFFLVTLSLEVMLSGISLRVNHMFISFCVGPLIYYLFTSVRLSKVIFVLFIIPLILLIKIQSFTNNKLDMALFSDGQLFYATPFSYVDSLFDSPANDKRNWKRLNYE